ncbi:MAG: aminotransferase class III-fold pyridoxal phosphate-dependent enzyme, partial [Bryobacteraceae bacterium]
QLFPGEKFGRVFYSDDGSTGVEAALRIVSQYWQLTDAKRRTFVSFRNGYHGDTAGAASLGAAALFGSGLSDWAAPILSVTNMEELLELPDANRIAAVIIEPIIQGAAGMKIWPVGTLQKLRAWCDSTGALLIADEVLTGFGRTGKMFACEHESIYPDLYVFAKGLSNGYLPVAITLVSNEIFEPFQAISRKATLFYGHSFTGNALGCAAALASLKIFEEERVLESLKPKIDLLRQHFISPSSRCVGMIGALDFPSSELATAVCETARGKGLLTRPIRETVVFMPPLCIEMKRLKSALTLLEESTEIVLSDFRESKSRPFAAI